MCWAWFCLSFPSCASFRPELACGMSKIDNLERLAALHAQGALTDLEFEHQKRDPFHGEGKAGRSVPFAAHAAACLVGSIVLIYLCADIAWNRVIALEDIEALAGLALIFSAWLIPHGVWLLMQRGSVVGTKALPLLSLLLVGTCWMLYLGLDVTSAGDAISPEAGKLSKVLGGSSGK